MTVGRSQYTVVGGDLTDDWKVLITLGRDPSLVTRTTLTILQNLKQRKMGLKFYIFKPTIYSVGDI